MNEASDDAKRSSLQALRERVKLLDKSRKTLVLSVEDVRNVVELADELDEENELLKAIRGESCAPSASASSS